MVGNKIKSKPIESLPSLKYARTIETRKSLKNEPEPLDITSRIGLIVRDEAGYHLAERRSVVWQLDLSMLPEKENYDSFLEHTVVVDARVIPSLYCNRLRVYSLHQVDFGDGD